MTPMIDIVFLLIIFFMTVSQVSEMNKERLELPSLEGSEDQKPMTLTVNVNQNGELLVASNKTSIAKLVSIVDQETRRAGDDPDRVNVVVRADERGQCRAVNEVVTALGQLQIKRIRIAVEVPNQ